MFYQNYYWFIFKEVTLSDLLANLQKKEFKQDRIKYFYEKWSKKIYPKLACKFYRQQYIYHETLILGNIKCDEEYYDKWNKNWYLKQHRESKNEEIKRLSERTFSEKNYRFFETNDEDLLLENMDLEYGSIREEIKKIWFSINTQKDNLNSLARYPIINYTDYLKTKHWKTVRAAMILLNEAKCAMCNHEESFYGLDCLSELEVHHKHYKNKGREKYEDLLLLCRSHHETIYRTYH